MKKNILITGATGNLGSATVSKFLSDGHRVIAIVSPGKKSLPGVITVEADLSQESKVQEVVGSVIAEHKSIDAALLLVGGYEPGNLSKTNGDLLKKMYSLNFETAYFVARPVFAQMISQATGGRIVFVGARTALNAKDGKNSMAYALSKSLIFKLSDFLNAEGAAKNVLSTVIVPSTIDTPANRTAMPDADFSSWVTPEAIAEILSFLVSEKANPLRDTVLKIYGKA